MSDVLGVHTATSARQLTRGSLVVSLLSSWGVSCSKQVLAQQQPAQACGADSDDRSVTLTSVIHAACLARCPATAVHEVHTDAAHATALQSCLVRPTHDKGHSPAEAVLC